MKPVVSLSTLLALVLLTGCAISPAPPDQAQEVAAMLANYERLAALKTEEQRKADQLVLQLREERSRSEELQQKIESLRTIDKDMHVRKKTP